MWLPNSSLGISLDPYLEWMSAKERAHQIEQKQERLRRLEALRARSANADTPTRERAQAA